MPVLLLVIILGIVEGVTEYLPVSSTGHLILATELMGYDADRWALFNIAIQPGAILAILIVYWQLITRTLGTLGSSPISRRLVANILIGFLPAAAIGFAIHKQITKYLFNGPVVAGAFIVGGLIILLVESRKDRAPRVTDINQLTAVDALKVGVCQCFGMIPGTSRSGATIIGGLLVGLSRPVATEFSFFLAIPTLIGASVLEVFKVRHELAAGASEYLPMFAIGFVVSFLAAWVCVRWLLRYVATHTFIPFAWYRIAFGIVVLATWMTHMVTWAS